MIRQDIRRLSLRYELYINNLRNDVKFQNLKKKLLLYLQTKECIVKVKQLNALTKSLSTIEFGLRAFRSEYQLFAPEYLTICILYIKSCNINIFLVWKKVNIPY